jgi:hypothetical protein
MEQSSSEHNMPNRGMVSIIVEPIRTRNKFNKPTNSGETTRFDDMSWQMTGEYEIISYNNLQTEMNELNHKQMQQLIKFLKSKEDEEDMGMSVKMMDYTLSSRETVHEFRMRAIQHPNQRTELITLFIEMPISNFTKVESLSTGVNSDTMTPKAMINNSRRTSLAIQGTQDTPTSLYKDVHQRTESSVKRTNIDTDPSLKKPVMNRIFCQFCRGLARPRIKMLEDVAWIPTSNKAYRTWANDVRKTLGQDGGRKLVILELGCEKKLRMISDTLLKQTAMNGTVLIRVNPSGVKSAPKTEKKEKPKEDSESLIVIDDDNSASAVQKIDQALREICEKLGFSNLL